MPLYKFKCKSCEWEFDYFLSLNERDTDILCTKCSNKSIRMRGGSSNPIIYDMVDKFRGKQNRRDIKEILNKRSKDYNKTIVGELVEKHGHRAISKTSSFNQKGLVKTVWDEK